MKPIAFARTGILSIAHSMVIGLVTLWLVPGAAAQATGLVVLDNPPLIVDATANTAAGWLLLQNTSAVPATFTISAGPFVSATTSNALGARINLQTSGTPYLAVRNMGQGSNLAVKVEVSNFLDAGEALAPVMINGAALALLRAERQGGQFNVTLEGAPADKPEVAMKRGAVTSIILRNADPVHYPVRWELEVEGQVISNAAMVLPATSTARIPVLPAKRLFHWSLCALMKDEVLDGRLIVRWAGPDGVVKREKVMPLRMRVATVPDFLRPLGFVLVLLVLFAGAACSLIMNNGIPNALKRLDLNDELLVLTKRIHSLAPQIDSSLRVLVRVQRKLLADMLESRWAISPDLVNVFKNVSAGIAGLKRQLEVLERMDRVYDRLEVVRGMAVPPTLLELAGQKLQEATVLLRSTAPPEADLQAAQGLVGHAATLVENIEKPSELLALKVASRVKRLRRKFVPLLANDERTKHFAKKLKHLFEEIATADYEEPANITPDLYARVDARTRRLEVLANYLEVGNNDLGQGFQERFKEYGEWLVSALQREGLAALEHAERLVRELQDGVFPEFLEAALTQPENDNEKPQAEIERDINYPRVNDPIQFRIVFNNDAFNTAAARQALSCTWDFTDGMTEKGWAVSHYFRCAKEYRITTTFYHRDGRSFPGPSKTISVYADANTQSATGGTETTILQKTTGLHGAVEQSKQVLKGRLIWFRESTRTRIELLRVAIALGAALLALAGGARNQLLDLDCMMGLVAVFLMGFGADTIKNLLTQK